MKKFFYLFSLVLLCLSCSDNDSRVQPIPEMVELSFSCSGELVDVVETAMTKANTSDDLYLFEFYYWDEHYAWLPYGIFFTDNPSAYTVSFLKNKRYACSAICIPNGKNLIAHNGDSYGLPFTNYYNNDNPFPKLNDKVYYGTAGAVFGLDEGLTTPANCNYSILPHDNSNTNLFNSIDKYFGSKVFTAEENVCLEINMFRMMFSISLTVDNFTEGKIVVLDKYILSPNDIPFDKVMELPYMPNATGRRGFTDDEIKNFAPGYTLNIKYVDEDGKTFEILNKTMDIKRLTKYEISFDLNNVLDSYKVGFDTNLQEENGGDTEKFIL